KTLDGENWAEYQKIQKGGTPYRELKSCGGAKATLEMGRSLVDDDYSAGHYLSAVHGVSLFSLGLPIGLRESDAMFDVLMRMKGGEMPSEIQEARGRLIDAMVDGHKYVYGKKVILFGESDFVMGMASFLNEIGVVPVVCATGSKVKGFKEKLADVLSDTDLDQVTILSGVDHSEIENAAMKSGADMIMGSSKGYPMAKRMEVPLLRLGFPIHDRFGGQRILHIGYEGALRLFDTIVNTCLQTMQEKSETGYSYI
ncbi:MAG: nitrogenase, partial [Planctomycetes bacterium]|nr:nitrogenase [Planctomycetota bacterium]